MDFVLVEDGLSAGYLRQQLAEPPIIGVKVGDFSVLLRTLSQLWLIPPASYDWYQLLQSAALSSNQWCWASSIHIDESGTLRQISRSLRFLLDHLPLNADLQPLAAPVTRQEHYYNDLVSFFRAMEGRRPQEQELAKAWLNQATTASFNTIVLHPLVNRDNLLPWQGEVVDLLLQLQIPSADTPVGQRLAPAPESPVGRDTGLAAFCTALFKPAAVPTPTDQVHWLTCRDIVEEVEALTSMVQSALDQGTPADQIAVLYPHQSDYPLWIEQSFANAGVLVSNIRNSAVVYDWQSALLRDLLDCHAPGATPMAWHSVLINPLMPWSRRQGHYLVGLSRSQQVEAVDDEVGRRMLCCLYQPVKAEASGILAWLQEVAAGLGHCRDSDIFTSDRFTSLLHDLQELFKIYANMPFDEQLCRVLSRIQPTSITLVLGKERLLHAVTLFSDRESLPFRVQELFVLGFNQGNYLFLPTPSGIIDRPFFDALANKIGLPLIQVADEQVQWQNRLRRLLQQASRRLTFTMARHAPDGSPLAPSETLLDMALCVQSRSALKPEQLLMNCREANHPLLHYYIADCLKPTQAKPADLHFSRDIMLAMEKRQGKRRGESPSSLERLMISPLAWLLERLNLRSQVWETQGCDIMLQGTIAHKVFELYRDHQEELWTADIFDTLFREAICQEADFLAMPQWRLEQAQLRQEIATALQAFASWCRQSGWRIEQVEHWLKGELWGWPVRGIVDAVLVRNEEVIILDYKKSSSPSRIKRLRNGYDLQTWVYRELYRQQEGSGAVCTGYYNLNDTTLVVDLNDNQIELDSCALKIVLPELPVTEQSAEARKLIEKRLKQVRAGHIELNSASDIEFWKSVGITPYVLEEHPVVSRFTIPAQEGD